MRARLKRFLLIFMMLALPLQAFASAAVLGCEFAHDDSGMQSVPVITSLGTADMDHAMSGCHETSEVPPAPSVGKHQCSHCAACYLAAAFPIPAVIGTAVAPIPYSPHLSVAESFSGFIPEGPERPPRTSCV